MLLTTLWYIREVDPTTLLLTGLTRDGVYLVEDGEVTAAVNNFRFNESPLDLLRRATQAGVSELTLPREWGDWVTRAAMPSLRIPDFHMSSVSQAHIISWVVLHERLLTRLVALSLAATAGDSPWCGGVRADRSRCRRCPSRSRRRPSSDADAVVADFAEQFSTDVSAIAAEQRSALWKALGNNTFGAVVQMYHRRLRAAGARRAGSARRRRRISGLGAGPVAWDHATDPSDAGVQRFLPTVADCVSSIR